MSQQLLNHPVSQAAGREKNTEINRDATVIRPRKSNGQLITGHMTPEEAREYLALRHAADAGNHDAQMILKLMRVREQFRQSPALVAEVQVSIDLLKTRMTTPAPTR